MITNIVYIKPYFSCKNIFFRFLLFYSFTHRIRVYLPISCVMMHFFLIRLLPFFLFFCELSTHRILASEYPPDCSPGTLMNDLLIVDYWNRQINDRLPVTYNNLLQGGYFAMPSARMGDDGEIGVGYSYVPPYRNYNLRCQILDRLELSGSYRIFHGIKDPTLSQHGFGDLSDKGVNFKFSLFSPEESEYKLPGIAFGLEDFMGTRGFHAQYVVLTQVILDYNLELSLGYGTHRIDGFFGGFNWIPFRNIQYRPLNILKTLSLTAEYDATPYHRAEIEKHPKGRVKKSPINFGIKYRAWDTLDLSLSYIRGDELSFSVATSYNFGYTEGFLPKIDDPLPYRTPINCNPLGIRRAEETLAAELMSAFETQSLTLLDIYISYNDELQKVLRLSVLNETYRLEKEVRCQIDHLLAALVPSDISNVVVVINSEGFPIQEYCYSMDAVRLFAEQKIGPYELAIFSPLTEVTDFDTSNSLHFRTCERHLYNFEVSPDLHTLFGSSRGKFKYALGVHLACNGFLWEGIYYDILLGYTFLNDMGKLKNYDILNPSRLPNVRSDAIEYYRQMGCSLDQGFLQKNWNLGHGFYARVAGGYFEEAYAGAVTEFLFYPLNSPWAIGIEGAILKKRNYRGLGFTNTVRQFDGECVSYHRFLGSQYFVNLYYDWIDAHLDFKISAGKFLADDWGVRNEITRYFPSGMRLTLWYTLTNGHDKINGKTYYDKGISFSMPFDIFYTYSERSRWNYGMSAWLRDVGVQAMSGQQLYELINEQRQ